ncbi:hypothetical protein ACK3F5_23300 (plasmid) [Photorhabdus asymbiotica UENP]
MTGVSERSQQSSNLKDEGYKYILGARGLIFLLPIFIPVASLTDTK